MAKTINYLIEDSKEEREKAFQRSFSWLEDHKNYYLHTLSSLQRKKLTGHRKVQDMMQFSKILSEVYVRTSLLLFDNSMGYPVEEPMADIHVKGAGEREISLEEKTILFAMRKLGEVDFRLAEQAINYSAFYNKGDKRRLDFEVGDGLVKKIELDVRKAEDYGCLQLAFLERIEDYAKAKNVGYDVSHFGEHIGLITPEILFKNVNQVNFSRDDPERRPKILENQFEDYDYGHEVDNTFAQIQQALQMNKELLDRL
jgi:hypothetical protein